MRLLVLLMSMGVVGVTSGQTNPVFNDPEAAQLNMSQFELTEAEAIRVEKLKALDVSFGVSNLSAVELLGKYSETQVERLKYARKHVIATADNIGRSQAWALAVYEVSQEQNMVAAVLNANPAIREGLATLKMSAPGDDWSGFDRDGRAPEKKRTLFVSLSCGDACVDSFIDQKDKVIDRTVSALDVVFVGSTSLDQVSIFDWAKHAGVTYEALESGILNLHIDNEEWVAFRNGYNDVPRLVR